MYELQEADGHLQVRFRNHFTAEDLKRLIHERFSMPDDRLINDIWIIGIYHARLGMSEVLEVVDQFSRLCTCDCAGRRTAFVVEPGLTEGILELLAKGIVRKLPFECRVFHSLQDAESWIMPGRQMTG